MRPAFFAVFAAVIVAACLTPGVAGARPAATTSPQRPQIFDDLRRLDINQLNLWTTNYGSVAWDLTTGNSGLEYPKGSGKTAMFAAGLWLGATVAGETRTVVAEYSMEYGPGPMVGGTFADPTLPQHRVYKVLAWSGDPADTGHVERTAPGPLEDPLAHDSWSEYMVGAVPQGAPWVTWLLPDPANPSHRVQVPGPAVPFGQLLWSVYNDADPARHTSDAGNSTPLGVEIQQSIVGVAGYPAAFLRYRIIHRGAQQLDDVIVSMWADPDLGGWSDDLVGSSQVQGMVYAYNATNADAVYGSSPPAIGVALLEGPKTATGDTLPATAAVRMPPGGPASPLESYNLMLGLTPDGSTVTDPNNTPTTFWYGGDPVGGTGWLDSNPGDRVMMISSGTFSMAPGDTQDVAFVILVGQGNGRLNSVSALRAIVPKNGPPPPQPWPLTNCPRPATNWAMQCPPASGELTPAQLQAVAARAGANSLLFEWPSGLETDHLCSTLSPPGTPDLRALAGAEFAALLANWSAGQLGIIEPDGQPVRLLGNTQVNCAGIVASTVADLVSKATSTLYLSAEYFSNNPAHPAPLVGYNWGGSGFGGGADFGWTFWGGTLDPAVAPDSFPNVEIRLSGTGTQKAYRYLRLEQADGSAPAGGREYRYAGYNDVPFQVWDTEHDVQLDVAFVERAITDASGTILGPGMQVASFDSTWGPTDEFDGGREYLFVLSRPYSPVARAEFAVDAAMDTAPILYALWSRLAESGAIIEDGDRIAFQSRAYAGSGIDALLLTLRGKPLSDAAVQQAYQQVIDCLVGINTGATTGDLCDDPTAVELSLVSAEADPDRVSLAWYTPEPALAATIERREDVGDWIALAQVSADGSGMIRYVDTSVVPGARYEYRLAFLDEGVPTRAGEVSVVVPLQLRLWLAGFVPNPARQRATVEFVLPARGQATLEVLDLLGRRIAVREVGPLGPGRARVTLDGAATLRPGIYVIRLRQAGVSVSRKAVMVR